MKKIIFVVLTLLCTLLLVQCKKSSPAPPPVPTDDDTLSNLVPGKYVIRTKYICPDGRGFILGSFSNYEVLEWTETNPVDIAWQKEDEYYTWTLQEIRALADIATTPGATVPVGFSLYQERPDGTFGYLYFARPPDVPEDVLDHGSGPSLSMTCWAFAERQDSVVGGKSAEFIQANPDYANGPSIVFQITSPTDSTYRISNRGVPFSYNSLGWNPWYIAVTAKPDGSNCDDYRRQPVFRNLIVGQGCTFIPSASNPYYVPDVCYITQLVLEKVE